ncbi:U4/U6 small nuclear ribonucleoprotein Prp3p [[Candida] railenensis]|uniref:U4/U6 small nuclear ribonucleoprotein Prp3p n=1 Tax=[Candida] railenensis TaxID=45579 RepID=A0A9P0QNM6_9ASCO|nr:U4/U6 small nuclear ribonucleoprotein Prp3p [[Candida] railenensis]
MKRSYDSRGTSNSDAIAKAKARLLQKRAKVLHEDGSSQDATSEGSVKGNGGLDVEIHPLLRTTLPVTSLTSSKNPLKQNVKSWFDPSSINPYLNQSDSHLASSRPSRALQFVEKGKYIARGNEMRAKLQQKKEEQDRLRTYQENGLTADENIGEQFYKPTYPPPVEWWDKPYFKTRNYDDLSASNLEYDNELAPISHYIQHPSFIPAPWEMHLPQHSKPMHLTKKERKRIRRNDRVAKHKDKQDRIKLGLDPPPPPKIKLSNLMNVLTNEAIQDPTGIEMKVREEVQERFENHMRENEARKLTKDEVHSKAHKKNLEDLSKGYFTTVYKIEDLSNTKNFYKLDINAKQLELMGICLLNPKFNLIIVQGGLKNINFYKKLLTRRIDWKEYVAPKSDEVELPDDYIPPDLSNNTCKIIWEGQTKDLLFQKWSIMRSQDDNEALQVLNRFNVENYWRQASLA